MKHVPSVIYGVIFLGVIVMIFLIGRLGRPHARTSAFGTPEEVAFLRLPADAHSIKYWDHWHDKVAVFGISEEAFSKVFPAIKFEEITEDIHYGTEGFGDFENPVWRISYNVRARNGLIYQQISKNGGGERILYDRDKGLGYYNYGAW